MVLIFIWDLTTCSSPSAAILAQATVFSHVDHCSSPLTNLPASILPPLLTAARKIFLQHKHNFMSLVTGWVSLEADWGRAFFKDCPWYRHLQKWREGSGLGRQRSQEVMHAQWQAWPTTCWTSELQCPSELLQIGRRWPGLYAFSSISHGCGLPCERHNQRQGSPLQLSQSLRGLSKALPDNRHSLKEHLGSSTQDPPLLSPFPSSGFPSHSE